MGKSGAHGKWDPKPNQEWGGVWCCTCFSYAQPRSPMSTVIIIALQKPYIHTYIKERGRRPPKLTILIHTALTTQIRRRCRCVCGRCPTLPCYNFSHSCHHLRTPISPLFPFSLFVIPIIAKSVTVCMQYIYIYISITPTCLPTSIPTQTHLY